jgi:hypothetical protein
MTAVTVAEYIPVAEPWFEVVKLTAPATTSTFTSRKFQAVKAAMYMYAGTPTDANNEYYATVATNVVTLVTAGTAADIYLFVFGANLGGT